MTKQAVFLDCDPGHDDAFAIVLAGHSPSLHLLGISTVFGNQSVEKTTKNALKMCAVSGLEHIKVFKGAAEPIFAERMALCPEIHGDTGLDGPIFPPLPHSEEAEPAVFGIEKTIREYLLSKSVKIDFSAKFEPKNEEETKEGEEKEEEEEKVVVICTGSLTNMALVLKVFPYLRHHIRIVLMGGAIGVGNTGPVAEFNIQIDPEAAHIVFNSGVDITMVPLEVTHTVLVTPEIQRKIAAIDSSYSKLFVELLLFFEASYRTYFAFESPPLHDPTAVCFVIDPSLFKKQLMRVDVEKNNPFSLGQTICDRFSLPSSAQKSLRKNVTVCYEINVDGFWDRMLAAIEIADKASCLNR